MITFQGKDIVIIDGVKYRKSNAVDCINCVFNASEELNSYCSDVWKNEHGCIHGHKIALGYKKIIPDRVILKYL